MKAAHFGLKLNHSKWTVISVLPTDFVFKVTKEPIETVKEFTYLGSKVTLNGNIDSEIQKRVCKTTSAFSCLSKPWSRKDLSSNLKVRLCKTLIGPVLLYAAETWHAKVFNLDRLKSFENCCIRKITGNLFGSSGQLLSQYGLNRHIGLKVIYMKRKYLGHVVRMSAERPPIIIFLYNTPAYWKRPPGGVRLTNERY